MKIYSDNAITKDEVNDLKVEIKDDHQKINAEIVHIWIAIGVLFGVQVFSFAYKLF